MSDRKAKVARILAAIERREADRVPIGEFFWTNFIRRAKSEKRLPDNFDPYRHWDLDMIVINPNMDPHITGIQVLEESPDRKVVRTGFGATIEMHESCPMPAYREFSTETWEQIESLRFDDAGDERRYFKAIDDQINSVGDA